MSADGSGHITVTAVADADVVKQGAWARRGSALRRRRGRRLDGDTGRPRTDDGGLQVELTHTFANPEEATALLQSINGSGGPLHDVRSDANGPRRRNDGVADRARCGSTVSRRSPIPTCSPRLERRRMRKRWSPRPRGPSDAVRVTVRAALPGKITSATRHVSTGSSVSWIVPLDGSQLDLGHDAVDDHGTAKIWGIASNAALIALVAWCLLAAAFISWVVRQRKRRGPSPQPPNGSRVTPLL